MSTANFIHSENLMRKAADAKTSEEAMRFSQAACNVANAMCALAVAREKGEK